jgi:predicted amidohydrolase
MKRVAIAQVAMRWSTQENLEAILWAVELAHSQRAQICAFSELALTGFHREISREAVSAPVHCAIQRLQASCAERSMAIAVGARP